MKEECSNFTVIFSFQLHRRVLWGFLKILFKVLFFVTLYEQSMANSVLFVALHLSELLMQSCSQLADWVRNKSVSHWQLGNVFWANRSLYSSGVKLQGTLNPLLIFFMRDFGSNYKRKAFLRMKIEIFF